MSSAVLLSIQPKWCEMIVNGKKTIEVRKTRPKLDPPFKCYIYETLGRKHTFRYIANFEYDKNGMVVDSDREIVNTHYDGCGKVIGKFLCDEICMGKAATQEEAASLYNDIAEQSCMSEYEFASYWNGKDLYAWHISDLLIYGKPREMGEFFYPPDIYCEKERCGGCPYDQVPDVNGEYAYDCEWKRPLTRPPQSWCYVTGVEV